MKERTKPKATKVKDRNLYKAWGQDPATLARKPYYAPTPEEAADKAFDSFITRDRPDTLFSYYATTYLPTIQHRSAAWQSQVFWAMDKYILPKFGEYPLSSIKRDDCQKFFNRLLDDLALASVRRMKIVFSTVMNLADADEKIVKNPLRIVRLPSDPEPEKTALTFQDLAKLYLKSSDRFRPPFLLCSCAGGLRIGEACAVTFAHLGKDDVLKVRQQIQQPKGGAIISKTLKTPQTKRDIPLPPDLAIAIRECNQVSGIYVSSDSVGGYLLPKNFSRELREACEEAKVTAVSPHELRHTFISLMENEIEAPAAIVAALAGKKDARVTSSYSHTHQEQLKKWLGTYWDRLMKEVDSEKSRPTTISETQTA